MYQLVLMTISMKTTAKAIEVHQTRALSNSCDQDISTQRIVASSQIKIKSKNTVARTPYFHKNLSNAETL